MSDRASLLRQRDFGLYLVVNVARIAASQIVAVGVGWQVYAIHRNPFDLGLVGLAEFVPLPLLALPAGQLADRYSRRLVLALSIVISITTTALLLVVTIAGPRMLWPFLLLAALTGAATALGSPAARALPPELVPSADLGTAFALRSTATQIGMSPDRPPGDSSSPSALSCSTPRRVHSSSCRSAARFHSRGVVGGSRGASRPRTSPTCSAASASCAGRAWSSGRSCSTSLPSSSAAPSPLAGVRALDPAHRARRPRHPAQRSGRGRHRSGSAAHTTATRGAGRPRAACDGDAVRAGDDRVRPLEIVHALARRARRLRLRRHDQRQHPFDDGRARDPRRSSRPRQRRRDGLHQRVESARRVRVRHRGRVDRHCSRPSSPAASPRSRSPPSGLFSFRH